MNLKLKSLYAVIILVNFSCEKNKPTVNNNETNIDTIKTSPPKESVYQNKTTELSKEEANKKLLDALNEMEEFSQVDISDDILTVKANISQSEAQKLSEGLLSQVSTYNKYINKVVVCDLNYNVLAYSKK